ncbi:hypothetical protein MAIT1_05173 [Magnetofaba australis IT-1]|uniref:Uncharacterized protein n=2 Tax=Magnetofaba TaxID=1472292 RepID=A0A1Y2K6G9_9PROT|nr:hypothetical protein MAIT1_05173 [Magnetofaba australis IT-1]
MMPGMDGLETLRHLRADPRYALLPVIMVTGNSAASDLAEAFSAGATDYVTKPIQRVELLARLKALIDLEEANRQMRQSEKRLRDLTASMAEGLLSVNDQMTVVFVNPQASSLLNLSEDQIIGYPIERLLRPESGLEKEEANAMQSMVEVCQGKSRKTRGESQFNRYQSAPFPASFSAAAIYEGEQFTGAVLSFRDITVQRHREERLRLAANIIENSQEGVIVVDPQLRIIDVNPAFNYITGYSRAEVIGKSPQILSSGCAGSAET